ncbi:MAG: aminotransferase class V-fold PLP-dependent enzyme [Roseburia sp.]|nr:aminotransferase class V-fold PLP-dependent enzyme [Roseburia sp.]
MKRWLFYAIIIPIEIFRYFFKEIKMAIYWNTNSTTRIRPEVSRVIQRYIDSNNFNAFQNPSDYTNASRTLFLSVVSQTRARFLKFINATADDFAIFTSSGSESNNNALAVAEQFIGREGTIIISALEHDSINLRCNHLKQLGYNIEVIQVDELGRYNYEQLEKIKCSGRVFISMMLVNNELGNIYDLKRIADIARRKWKDVIIHTDAVQAFGKLPIDVQSLGVDMLSVSGHKIGCPKGIGVLYVKRGIPIQPLIYGHQECGYRGGTENVPYIAGLEKALEVTQLQMTDEYATVVKNYRNNLQDGILDICKRLNRNAYVNGDVDHRVNNTTSITIKGIDNVRLVSMASDVKEEGRQERTYFSTGSACNSSACAASSANRDHTKASAVLKAIGHPNYREVIRLSVGDELYNYGSSGFDYDTSDPKLIFADIKARVRLNLKSGLAAFESILKKFN